MKTLILALAMSAIPAVAQTPFGDQRLFSSPLNSEAARANITIKDYIAIQAMTGMMSRMGYSMGDGDIKALARTAYKVADAMLNERETQKELEIK